MATSGNYPFESAEKYLKKLDGGLAGREFALEMDDGSEYALRFVSADTVEWSAPDTPLRWEKYGALRADDATWFAASVLSGTEKPVCVTLVLDEATGLVTMVISRLGVFPLRPRLVDVEFIFGAIRRPGEPLPVRRHSFSRDLVGRKINWHYSTGFINTHIYISERYCRTRSMHPDRGAPQEKKDEPLYEEPMRVVRIREGMYLLSFVEDNMNRLDPTHGGNNLVVLTNLAEGFDCGRTFSRRQDGGLDHGLFRAYGETTDEDVPVEHEPSPYRI